MAKINVRSPYFINVSDSNLESAKLELIIYHGHANTSFGTSITYTLSATAVENNVNFEISSLIKDYINSKFNGDYPAIGTSEQEATTIYVDYRVTDVISGTSTTRTPVLAERAYDGYGYFEDGANPQLTQGYLQSNTTILKPDDAPLRIPIDPVNTTSVAFFSKGEQIYTFTVGGPYRGQDQILYISNEAAGVDSYEDRVLLDGGTYEGSSCLDKFLSQIGIYPADTVYVDGTGGVTVIDVQNIEECKFTPYKLTFINKFGAYQDLWMFKRSDLSISKTEEEFRSTIISNGSYNTYEHQYKTFNVNAKESLTLNTGFYPEEYNEVFKQMMLSERIWIEYDNKTLPVKATSNDFSFRTRLNDKLINYTIQIEFAYDKINTVR